MGGVQQLTPLLLVSGPEPHLCSSSPLPFLVQLWAAPQEPLGAIVTPTDAVLVLRSVPFNTHHAPRFYLRACLFQTKHSIGGQSSGSESGSTTSVSLRWEAACMLSLSSRCLVGKRGWL